MKPVWTILLKIAKQKLWNLASKCKQGLTKQNSNTRYFSFLPSQGLRISWLKAYDSFW
jgi:hypothetical protein